MGKSGGGPASAGALRDSPFGITQGCRPTYQREFVIRRVETSGQAFQGAGGVWSSSLPPFFSLCLSLPPFSVLLLIEYVLCVCVLGTFNEALTKTPIDLFYTPHVTDTKRWGGVFLRSFSPGDGSCSWGGGRTNLPQAGAMGQTPHQEVHPLWVGKGTPGDPVVRSLPFDRWRI